MRLRQRGGERADRTTAALAPRAPTPDRREPARRPETADRGRCSQAVCSLNSPPMPRLDARHRHYHRAHSGIDPVPFQAASAPLSRRSSVEFPSRIPTGQTATIRGEYGQRWEPQLPHRIPRASQAAIEGFNNLCGRCVRCGIGFAREPARCPSPRDGERPVRRSFHRSRRNWRAPRRSPDSWSDAAPDQSASPPMDCRD
jgi:hypothetical protein